MLNSSDEHPCTFYWIPRLILYDAFNAMMDLRNPTTHIIHKTIHTQEKII